MTNSSLGRIIVITGARQVGKTTLIKKTFPNYKYLSFDDPIKRISYAKWSCDEFHANGKLWIIDEAQKMPSIFETVKAAYDDYPEMRFVLSGSSQIMLLKNVRESLAGRAVVIDVYPLVLPEIISANFDEQVKDSVLIKLLNEQIYPDTLCKKSPVLDNMYARNKMILKECMRLGAMPAYYGEELMESEFMVWLENYVAAYLQRDIQDLARLNDLDSFIKAEKALASRCAKLINFSDIARLAGISPATAKKYMNYLEMSYQVFSLEAYSRNPDKRLSKMPKCIFVDTGVLRILTGITHGDSGDIFENHIIAEIIKQIKSYSVKAHFYHLRTADGRKVDLLLETEKGFYAFEIKSSERVSTADARHLRDLQQFLDKPLIASYIVSNDDEIQIMGDKICAVPAAWLLGACV